MRAKAERGEVVGKSNQIKEILEQLWMFVRGDMSAADFEQWAYSKPMLESCLGEEFYLEVISTDFRDKDAVHAVRKSVRQFAQDSTNLRCQCITLQNLADVEMGGDFFFKKVFRTLEEQVRRGDPYWWLSVYECKECGQWWLVAQEERQNDVIFLKRLSPSEGEAVVKSGDWPNDFDKYEDLLRLGQERGHRWQFADPLGDSSLVVSAADLARERPGISVSDLAELLNLSKPLARKVAKQAIEEDRVFIDLESGISN